MLLRITILDGFELPGVILGFHVDAHLAVVVLLAADECLGRVFGEVTVHYLPALVPASDGVIVKLSEQLPLIVDAELQEVAFAVCLDPGVQFGLIFLVAVLPLFFRAEPRAVLTAYH